MSNQVRTAANDAKSRCLTEYKIDSLKAERARATLASVFGNKNLPLQDSLARRSRRRKSIGPKEFSGIHGIEVAWQITKFHLK